MNLVKLSSKNQIVVPREARDSMGVGSGDQLLAVVKGGVTLLLPKPDCWHDELAGSAPGLFGEGYVDDERMSW